MKTFILISLLVFYLFNQGDLHGIFEKRGKDFKYSLKINRDSTFVLRQESVFSYIECFGKWSILGDTMQLQCKEDTSQSPLSSGYMVNRVNKVIVLNEKKLKLDNVVLKRIKE